MKRLVIAIIMLGSLVAIAGTPAIASKLPVASDGVVRPYGICELGDTGYNRYSGNQYSGKHIPPRTDIASLASLASLAFLTIRYLY
jgi:hypothetical protein